MEKQGLVVEGRRTHDFLSRLRSGVWFSADGFPLFSAARTTGGRATVNKTFGKLQQLLSSAYMGFSHGTNDAQKTMGIIALALLTGTSSGAFDQLPGWLSFLHTPLRRKRTNRSPSPPGSRCFAP